MTNTQQCYHLRAVLKISVNFCLQFEPIIEEKNQQHLHHFVLYECHVPDSESHYEKWLDVDGVQCYSANMPNSWNYCSSLLLGWAVGSEGKRGYSVL